MSLVKNECRKYREFGGLSPAKISKRLGISAHQIKYAQITALAKIKLIIDKNPELKESLRSYL